VCVGRGEVCILYLSLLQSLFILVSFSLLQKGCVRDIRNIRQHHSAQFEPKTAAEGGRGATDY
jgi:hypothetical protein